MNKLIYCVKTDCKNNIAAFCECDMLSINDEGFCPNFEKKEIDEQVAEDFKQKAKDFVK